MKIFGVLSVLWNPKRAYWQIAAQKMNKEIKEENNESTAKNIEEDKFESNTLRVYL